MIIGILEADVLAADVRSHFGSYADMFKGLLNQFDNQLGFRVYQVTEFQYPQHGDECDGYLITGSQHSAYDELPWLSKLKAFVADMVQQGKPLIGICFGHQLIAQSLGGVVQKYTGGWGVGLAESQVFKTDHWMQPLRSRYSLLVTHQDQVIELPAGAECLAGNDFCAIAAYQIPARVLCFQGHPEFDALFLKHLLDKRRDSLGEALYQKALLEIQQTPDHLLVAQWILNFIGQSSTG